MESQPMCPVRRNMPRQSVPYGLLLVPQSICIEFVPIPSRDLSSPPSKPLQAARQRCRAARIAGDDENRVVALNRPDSLCKLRAIDGLGECRRLSPPGAKHDELLDAVGAAKELSSGAFERRK